MAGPGLEQVLGVAFANNSVIHMLSGKSVSRAVRRHFLVDSVLIAMLSSIAFNIPLDTHDRNVAEDVDEGNEGQSTLTSDASEGILQQHLHDDGDTASSEENDTDSTPQYPELSAALCAFGQILQKQMVVEELD